MVINRNSSAPTFKQLKDILLERIKKSEPSSKFHSVRELMREFNLSQASVDKALFELENENYIYKQRGKGTFIAEKADSHAHEKGAIALIITQINHSSFFSDIARGVENKIFELGYQMVLCSSYEDISREKEYLKRLVQNNTKGVVYASSSSVAKKYLHLDEISAQVPLSIIDVATKNILCDYVTTDDEAGAYEAVTHLIKKGHDKIAILTVVGDTSTIVNRFNGYKRALKDNRRSMDENLIIQAEHCTEEDAYKSVHKSLTPHFDVSAIFCTSDSLAKGAMQALYEQNIKIPDQLTIIGFGGVKFDNPYNIELSTVSQPAIDMGRKAVELLVERIEGKRPFNSRKEVILPTRLCIKET